jgi:hypothetical protein
MYKLVIQVMIDSGDGPELYEAVNTEADTPRDLMVYILDAIYDGAPLESIELTYHAKKNTSTST